VLILPEVCFFYRPRKLLSGENVMIRGRLAIAVILLFVAAVSCAGPQVKETKKPVVQSAEAGNELAEKCKELYVAGLQAYTENKYNKAIKDWETVIKLAPNGEYSKKARINISKVKKTIAGIKNYMQ
jgi:outer membrane protein assembly factor BamD (BamD/ComL family)